MSLFVEHPVFFWAFLALIPALWFSVGKYRALIKTLADHNNVQHSGENFATLKRRFVLRTVCRCLAWVTLVLAVSGISWGSVAVPVQKSGRAVAFVFDISYSMEANDTESGATRLEAAAGYAERLLSRLEGASVSVVLAKGNASIAIPSTEDFESIKTLLKTISPDLLTAEGTSLGSGVDMAVASFPSQSAQTSYIWLFTDGEETDDALTAALNNASKNGIPVSIIGFGSTSESLVVAGDGYTKVSTALREEQIKKAMAGVQRKSTGGKENYVVPSVTYVNYTETGSAYKLLSQINMSSSASKTPKVDGNGVEEETTAIAYEIQSVNRRNIFILMTIILFALSVVCGELDIGRKKNGVKIAAATLCFTFMLTGCSEKVSSGVCILQGQFDWNRGNYSHAVADFLEAYNDSLLRNDQTTMDYATYGLASTYIMQDENDAALQRYAEISEDAPVAVKFAVLYNSGIIAHRHGDYSTAAEYFKQALLIDSTNTNAKINLELSLQENSVQSNPQQDQQQETETKTGEQDYEESIYSLIRENELNQWKNKQQKSEGSAKDY